MWLLEIVLGLVIIAIGNTINNSLGNYIVIIGGIGIGFGIYSAIKKFRKK
jgi:disulfide bond formation protein DsbB